MTREERKQRIRDKYKEMVIDPPVFATADLPHSPSSR